MTPNEEVINEYLLDAYGLKQQQVDQAKAALQQMTDKYSATLNSYAEACRRADRMQKAGELLRAVLGDCGCLDEEVISGAIRAWEEAIV